MRQACSQTSQLEPGTHVEKKAVAPTTDTSRQRVRELAINQLGLINLRSPQRIRAQDMRPSRNTIASQKFRCLFLNFGRVSLLSRCDCSRNTCNGCCRCDCPSPPPSSHGCAAACQAFLGTQAQPRLVPQCRHTPFAGPPAVCVEAVQSARKLELPGKCATWMNNGYGMPQSMVNGWKDCVGSISS